MAIVGENTFFIFSAGFAIITLYSQYKLSSKYSPPGLDRNKISALNILCRLVSLCWQPDFILFNQHLV